MPKYRHNLAELSNEFFLTDGGLETTLIFHDGIDLPEFAAFVLLEKEDGRKRLADYFRQYIAIAKEEGVGFILEAPTWRANADWAAKLGYSSEAIAKVNQDAIAFLKDIRDAEETEATKMLISGCIGPRGDGYSVTSKMSVQEAEDYHRAQITAFSRTDADLVSAMTMNYVEEAIGIVKASQSVDIPVMISFTVETDGKLPSGQSLKDAIQEVDRTTNSAPIHYMINCAHPTHFADALAEDEAWKDRIRAIRANASIKSHAELDECEELDEGNPAELGEQHKDLKSKLKNLNIVGGCCGTDHRHVKAVSRGVRGK